MAVIFCFSVIPSGHLTQRLSVKPTLSGQRSGVLRPSGGQAGQLFTRFAALASAQLSTRHATGTLIEHATSRARVYHCVRAQRGRRHHRRWDGRVR